MILVLVCLLQVMALGVAVPVVIPLQLTTCLGLGVGSALTFPMMVFILFGLQTLYSNALLHSTYLYQMPKEPTEKNQY